MLTLYITCHTIHRYICLDRSAASQSQTDQLVIFIGMLLGLLLVWVHDGRPWYPSMKFNGRIAYVFFISIFTFLN